MAAARSASSNRSVGVNFAISVRSGVPFIDAIKKMCLRRSGAALGGGVRRSPAVAGRPTARACRDGLNPGRSGGLQERGEDRSERRGMLKESQGQNAIDPKPSKLIHSARAGRRIVVKRGDAGVSAGTA